MLVIEDLRVLVLLAIAAASVAVTISNSKLFKPMRLWLDVHETGFFHFVSELIHCYYCLGHWTAMFFYLLVWPHPVIIHSWLIDACVNYFILVGITSIISAGLLLLIYTLKQLMD